MSMTARPEPNVDALAASVEKVLTHFDKGITIVGSDAAVARGHLAELVLLARANTDRDPEPVDGYECARGHRWARLREVTARMREDRAALRPERQPRYDEVWEEAMELEERLRQSPDLTGSILTFEDEAAAAFATATDVMPNPEERS